MLFLFCNKISIIFLFYTKYSFISNIPPQRKLTFNFLLLFCYIFCIYWYNLILSVDISNVTQSAPLTKHKLTWKCGMLWGLNYFLEHSVYGSGLQTKSRKRHLVIRKVRADRLDVPRNQFCRQPYWLKLFYFPFNYHIY